MRYSNLYIYAAWLLFTPALLTGSVFYEPRLGAEGISINMLFFALSFILMIRTADSVYNFIRIFIFLVPISIWLLLSFPFFETNLLGIEKYVNSLLLGGMGAWILLHAHQKNALNGVLKILLLTFILLFLAALLWKLKYGFWQRHVSYFLNGPIIFGKHMAIAVLLVYYFKFSPIKKYSLYMIFLFGVFWSMSKGPIIAITIVFLVIYARDSLKKLVLFISGFGIACFVLITGFIDLSESKFKRLQIGIQALAGSSNVEDSGSVGARMHLYKESVILIEKNSLLGVGPGKWGDSINTAFTYPHNFFLEIFSEMGVFMGLFLLLPFIIFIKNYKHPLLTIPVFLLIAQQVSGDLNDARWLLVFSLFVFYTGDMSQKQISNFNFHNKYQL
jgi:hypothetical protein